MTVKGKTARRRAATLKKNQEAGAAIRKANSDAMTAKSSNDVNQALTPAQKAAFEAKAALDEEQKAVTKACFAEVKEVLKKWSCRLHARPVTVPRSDGLFVLGADVVITQAPLEMPEEVDSGE